MKFQNLLIVFTLVLVLFFSTNLSLSQNCGTTQCAYRGNLSETKYKQELDKYDAIFYGEVISQSDTINPTKGFPYRRLRIKVLETWKGIESDEVEIDFAYYDSDCANLGESGKMIFYVSSIDHQSSFYMSWCTKYSFNDEKTRKIFGKGKVIEQPQLSPTPTEPVKGFWQSLWENIVSFF